MTSMNKDDFDKLEQSITEANVYMQDEKIRDEMIRISVTSSSAVEDIHLSPEAHEAFIKILEDPPRDCFALKELLNKPSPWE